MVEHDDESHYEVSLTAGQAFIGVVLILGSLVAAFTFGIVIGTARGKAGVRQPDPVTITEQIDDSISDFSAIDEETVDEPEGVVEESPESGGEPVANESPAPVETPRIEERVWSNEPHVAQLLSTTDGDQAESLAARLIEGGFESAYVERVPRDEAGMLYRVRIRFPDEKSARDAESRLSDFSSGEIWIAPAE